MLFPGEERAWELLSGLDPETICKNASVSFDDKSGCYILKSFCFDFSICPVQKTIKSLTPQGQILTERYGYFFVHSCLWFLIDSKDIPFTGRLVRPTNIKGGDLFFMGSHVLPLDSICKKYEYDAKAFLRRGKDLCGEVLGYGDASVKLYPLPRIPVTIIFWVNDEEFPSRADLLLDSSCEFLLPIDVVWSTTMLAILMML